MTNLKEALLAAADEAEKMDQQIQMHDSHIFYLMEENDILKKKLREAGKLLAAASALLIGEEE